MPILSVGVQKHKFPLLLIPLTNSLSVLSPPLLHFYPFISPDESSNSSTDVWRNQNKAMVNPWHPRTRPLAQDRTNGGHSGLVSVIHAAQRDHKSRARFEEGGAQTRAEALNYI